VKTSGGHRRTRRNHRRGHRGHGAHARFPTPPFLGAEAGVAERRCAYSISGRAAGVQRSDRVRRIRDPRPLRVIRAGLRRALPPPAVHRRLSPGADPRNPPSLQLEGLVLVQTRDAGGLLIGIAGGQAPERRSWRKPSRRTGDRTRSPDRGKDSYYKDLHHIPSASARTGTSITRRVRPRSPRKHLETLLEAAR